MNKAKILPAMVLAMIILLGSVSAAFARGPCIYGMRGGRSYARSAFRAHGHFGQLRRYGYGHRYHPRHHYRGYWGWRNGYYYPYYDPYFESYDEPVKQPPPPPPPQYIYKGGTVVKSYGWIKQADGTQKWGEIGKQEASPGAEPKKIE